MGLTIDLLMFRKCTNQLRRKKNEFGLLFSPKNANYETGLKVLVVTQF